MCVDEERSGCVCERDEEIGELVLDVTSESVEEVGGLGEDGGGVRALSQGTWRYNWNRRVQRCFQEDSRVGSLF